MTIADPTNAHSHHQFSYHYYDPNFPSMTYEENGHSYICKDPHVIDYFLFSMLEHDEGDRDKDHVYFLPILEFDCLEDGLSWINPEKYRFAFDTRRFDNKSILTCIPPASHYQLEEIMTVVCGNR